MTVQNTPDLTKPHVQQFKQWLRAIRRTKFASNWIGGFYTIELTNEGNGWHLHAHLLVDAMWIDAFQLSVHWSKVTNGLGKIVRVRDARDKHYLHEVTKYAVKGNALAAWTPAEIVAFIDAFSGVRTFGVFGSLYGKRTEWKAWLATLKKNGHTCECGCCDWTYYTEATFLQTDLAPETPHASIPPPIFHPMLPGMSPPNPH